MLHTPDTTDTRQIADAVATLGTAIRAGQLLTARMLERSMETAFDAPASSGAWDWRCAYDALETASAHAVLMDGAAPDLAALCSAEQKRPTQTKRSEEQIRLQQFSTPLPFAFLAAKAAAITSDDVVLEPSAGTGALAVFAKRAGASLIVNEIDPRRRALLEIVTGQRASGFDAAQIDDLLAPSAVPSVVLINPPFASSFDRAEDKHMAARHLISAAKRLAPGGRLVAIMPMRFCAEREPDYWKALAETCAIRLSMGMDGAVYRKQGTGVETRLIVADKLADEAGDAGCVFGTGADLKALNDIIEGEIIPPRAPVDLPKPVTAKRRPAPIHIAKPKPTAKPARAAMAKPAPVNTPLSWTAFETPRTNDPVSDVYASYRPQRVDIAGAMPHPTPLVESLAMASVAPPVPQSTPTVPARLIETGALSEAQLETAIYASDAHARFLPGAWSISDDWRDVVAAREDDGDAVPFRAGFFLGDGTGCGKGRQVASVILDNWLASRRRALWVSKTDKLFEDAVRDWTDIGGSPTDIKSLSRWKPGEAVNAANGILFTTYATLRSEGKDGTTRLQQIVDWLAADRPEQHDPAWGPVIAFDEAHAMGNAAGGEDTGRGKKTASQQGIAGLRLQNAVPEARVVYVSATGATTVENLAYATRLGLWGAGADYPFPSREAFLSAMHMGGVAAMEVVARDLKAMGLYIARSLSFEGVEYAITEHDLTDRQREVYDAWADAFQIIHTNLDAAMRATNLTDIDGSSNNGQRKSAVMSRFESLKQRFFSHMLTGMKTPTMCDAISADLEAGHSAVIQLVSTGEALLTRRLEGLDEDEKADLNLDLTPREYVLGYMQEAFPVQLQRVIEDEDGNKTTTTVLDEETGAPVLSREAAALRDALIEKLALLDSVPTALDQIVWHFGPDAVAEVTGRSKRPVYRGTGETKRLVIEKRSASAGAAETDAFMAGDKRILVFSEAGGTGRSYHAAASAKNQQRRIHYLLEPGWKADSAVQGLGRSHRSAQVSAPMFKVMATDVQGEKRFISTIARRLDTLGALTKGQRQTGSQGLFRAEDSLESPVARSALRQFYTALLFGKATSITYAEFEAVTGLALETPDGAIREDLPPMSRFLNRLLALRIDMQNAILEELTGIIAERTETAREAGTLDIGVETIRADTLALVDRRVIHTDTRTGAETELVTLERADKVEKISATHALGTSEARIGLAVNNETGEPVILRKARSDVRDDGTTNARVKLVGPAHERYMVKADYDAEPWVECDEGAFHRLWNEATAKLPDMATRRVPMVTGLLLPIWKLLPEHEQRIWRAVTDDGQTVLGRVLSEADAAQLKAILDPTEALDAASILTAIVDEGRRIGLAHGAALKMRRVGAGNRIEVEDAPAPLVESLKAVGCFTEIIQWRTRVFVPFDPEAREESGVVIEKVLAILPVT